jgi:hypothetical protein
MSDKSWLQINLEKVMDYIPPHIRAQQEQQKLMQCPQCDRPFINKVDGQYKTSYVHENSMSHMVWCEIPKATDQHLHGSNDDGHKPD